MVLESQPLPSKMVATATRPFSEAIHNGRESPIYNQTITDTERTPPIVAPHGLLSSTECRSRVCSAAGWFAWVYLKTSAGPNALSPSFQSGSTSLAMPLPTGLRTRIECGVVCVEKKLFINYKKRQTETPFVALFRSLSYLKA